jgi:hypothetical protein
VKRIAVAAFALVVLPVAAHAQSDELFGQVGGLLGLRAYALGAMEYCTKYVDARPDFAAAADAWKQRNAADSAALDKVATPLVTPKVQAEMDKMLSARIAGDVAAADDKVAFCVRVMDAVNSGDNDFAKAQPDEIARVRAVAGG